MRSLDGSKPVDRNVKRIDFGDAPISNCKYDCEKCLLKAEGCVFIVNTIRCEVAHQRLKRILEEDQEKEDEEEEVKKTSENSSLVEDERKSLTDYMNSLEIEKNNETKEDEDDD